MAIELTSRGLERAHTNQARKANAIPLRGRGKKTFLEVEVVGRWLHVRVRPSCHALSQLGVLAAYRAGC